jgi:hypothetical protein
MHFVSEIAYLEPKEKTKDTLGKHTVIKSNAQLRFKDQREAESPPPSSPVHADLVTASSSTQTASPTFDVMLSRILNTVLSIQREVNTMSVRVKQNHINIRRCLRHFEPRDDDEDDGHD